MSIITSATASLRALASRLLKANPVIVREMRARMRGPRAFWLMTGYLVGLGLLAYGLYRIVVATMQYGFGSGMPPQSAFIGQILFAGLAFMELLFVCFITPALTAGSISGEVERRTYDMLLATPLRPASVIMGKLIASLTYANLLILAAIPLSSVIYLFGGVALRDMAQAIGLMVVVTVAYGALGLFFSALTRRTAWASVLTYVVVLAFTLGSIFLWGVLSAAGNGQPAPRAYLYLSPLTAMASAIFAPGGSMGRGPGDIFQVLTLGDFVFQGPGRPLWQYTVVLYLAMTVILTTLTTQLVKPVRRWHWTRRGLFRLLALLIALTGALWFVFATDFGTTGWRSTGGTNATPTPPSAPRPVIAPGIERRIVIEGDGKNEPPLPTPTLPPTPTPLPTLPSPHPTLPPTPTAVPLVDGDARATTAGRAVVQGVNPP